MDPILLIQQLAQRQRRQFALNRFFRWVGHAHRILIVYLAVAGLVTFSLFILEEAYQTAMFGTWPAQDANDWQLVLQGSDLMESIAGTMRTLNNVAGWIQPLAFVAYGRYADSADYYVTGLRAKAFARAPEVFEGRPVEFVLRPRRVVMIDGERYFQQGRVHVAAGDQAIDAAGGHTARGVVRIRSGHVVVEEPHP